jgi:hypothetical protein
MRRADRRDDLEVIASGQHRLHQRRFRRDDLTRTGDNGNVADRDLGSDAGDASLASSPARPSDTSMAAQRLGDGGPRLGQQVAVEQAPFHGVVEPPPSSRNFSPSAASPMTPVATATSPWHTAALPCSSVRRQLVLGEFL